MVVKSWEQIPFTLGVNNLNSAKVKTNLPFLVSCGTQQGLNHFENSIGNQDAISIDIGSLSIIGAICDGCTNSSKYSVNEFTSNQVGANLLSCKIITILRNLVKKSGVKSIFSNLEEIQQVLLDFTELIIKSLQPKDNDDKLCLLNNLFTTTFLALAIDKNDYCILSLGDGVVLVNGVRKTINYEPGKYLSSYLENNVKGNGFQLVDSGKSKNLNSLMLCSDGFDEKIVLANNNLEKFIEYKYPSLDTGFIDGLPEFRRLFLTPFIHENDIFDQWPTDDSSFLIVRRVSGIKKPNMINPKAKVNNRDKKKRKVSSRPIRRTKIKKCNIK